MSAENGRRHLHCVLGLVPALAALVLLAGCIPPLPQVNDLKEVQPNEVVLVGRVELDPPLSKDEQEQASNVAMDENTMLFYVHSKPTPIGDPPGSTDVEDWVAATYGKTFYARSPLRRSYFTVGLLQLQRGNTLERIWLPAGFYVEAKPGDKAVYFGTLRYHRNEYFDITKVDLIDEYTKEKKAFEKKFGRSVKLVKRLPKAYDIPKESK